MGESVRRLTEGKFVNLKLSFEKKFSAKRDVKIFKGLDILFCMGNVSYPGMRGASDLVGKYYLFEILKIVSRDRYVSYFREDGSVQLRDSKTGRFVSPKKSLAKLVA